MQADRPRGRGPGVRLRVTAIATVVVAIVLVVVSVLLIARQRASLTDDLDELLVAEARRIAVAVSASGEIPPVADDDVVAIVLDANGQLVDATDGERGADVLSALQGGAGTVEIDGQNHRIVTVEVDSAAAGQVILAGSDEDVGESIADLTRSLLWLIPPALVILSGAVWLLVGRTLRTVERIRSQVASIDVDELDRRVPVPGGDDEIARLARTMNSMLERLETSVRRQQQFVADASHELRTPLTRMRVELEVDERDPAGADPAATRRSQLDEITGMQHLLEDLLLLARGDARTTAGGDVVDLDDIVLDEVGELDRTLGAAIDLTRVSGAQVVGSAGELRRMVRNLLDNAGRHARTGVWISLAEADGWAVLTVDDDGPGIPPEHRQHVFERFTRLDASRTGSGHAGLGLAIVGDIVGRHGGRVTAGAAPQGGARLTVALPAAGTPRVPDVTAPGA